MSQQWGQQPPQGQQQWGQQPPPQSQQQQWGQQPPPPQGQQQQQWGAPPTSPAAPQGQQQWGAPPPPQGQHPPQAQQWGAPPSPTAPGTAQYGAPTAPYGKPGQQPPSQQQQQYGAPMPPQQQQFGGQQFGGAPMPPHQQQQFGGQQFGGAPMPPQQQQQMWYSQAYGMQDPQQAQQMELMRLFAEIDRDRSGSIALDELKNASFYGKRLGYDTVRKIMAMFDTSRTGQIGFETFAYMHRFIKDSLDTYTSHLAGKPVLALPQAMQALQQQGIRYSEDIVRSTAKAMRASRGPEHSHASSQSRDGLSFDEYLELVTHFCLLRSVFERRDQGRTGRIALTMEEFVGLTIEII